MSPDMNIMFFHLIRSAVSSIPLTDDELAEYSPDLLQEFLSIAKKHDVAHLIVLGLKKNGLLSDSDPALEKIMLKAAYRYERLNYEYKRICSALEEAEIPFIPLKGSILRRFYPEPWMRTSCDIDVLVHKDDLESAIEYLSKNLNYEEKERSAHDISLFSPSNIRLELHFDLVEEGYANNAIETLNCVWDNVSPAPNHVYMHEMSNPFFYFYHFAHMAKHFEYGGCGIRPFLDLWILDKAFSEEKDLSKFIDKVNLTRFANVTHALCEVWFGNGVHDEITLKIQDYIVGGGAYGTTKNRVAIHQKKKGGRIGYILSRMFVPIERLKRYYPILDRYPILMPFMQIRRWFMLADPKISSMAKNELKANRSLDKSSTDEMNKFMDDIGLFGNVS